MLDQTYENIELIVNCSKDKTLDIVKSYDDNRIKVIESNICQLNLALLNSIGEYIARIDDVCVKERFEKQVNILEKNNLDLVGSNIDENDTLKGFKNYPETNEEIEYFIKQEKYLIRGRWEIRTRL